MKTEMHLSALRDLDPAPLRATDPTLRLRSEARLQQILATAPTPGPQRQPRPVRRRVMLASVAALLLAGVIVATDVIIPGKSGASAEAAQVLEATASATITASDPPVGPGQYLKIDTKAVYPSFGGLSGPPSVWLEQANGQMYVPADRNGQWTWNREARTPIVFFSDLAKERAAEGNPMGKSQVIRADKGAFYGSPQIIFNGMPLDDAIKSLPRDPGRLLDVIYKQTHGLGPNAETEALISVADILRKGVIPADLRAALYKAAALIPGVTVSDRQATLDGRNGVAIGISNWGGYLRQDIIVDPQNGLLIGERTVLLRANGEYPGVPEGTAISWTAVETSVVGSAP
ncbi:CU044_5270 family protein [Arthrobacter sp. AQ5-05]|uniref:CU044_5270 family protein n=1 Tax=Arthrobacter sp. AQ5-05 TaxID=2184581 RepID=UPI0012B5BA86|nr:CU044_5270 family protein [Arthrobacter sp. AQ5-05]